jgi:uncharacterized integral membrane protein (TIGR00698 family)
MKLRNLLQILIGLATASLLAALAFVITGYWDLLGTSATGLLLGLIISPFLRRSPKLDQALSPGLSIASKYVLQTAVALLGLKISLGQAFRTGASSILVMVGSLAVSFLVATMAGKFLKVERRTAVLIGAGTGICGASAIAATGPVIKARKEELSYSFSVIFLFNVIALFLFPAIGRLLGLNDASFGLWAGTAINDTSSVVATAYSWSSAAGDYAVVVKLTRTLMIIPVTLALGWLAKRGTFGPEAAESKGKVASVPWFLIAFLALSALRTIGLNQPIIVNGASNLSAFLICVALAAIGLSTDWKKIRSAGWKPLVLGMLTWAAVATSSLLLNALKPNG